MLAFLVMPAARTALRQSLCTWPMVTRCPRSFRRSAQRTAVTRLPLRERGGAVYYAYRTKLRHTYHVRPNLEATDALFAPLGITR